MAFFKENNTDFLFDYFNVFFMCDVFLADYYNDRNLSSFEKAGIKAFGPRKNAAILASPKPLSEVLIKRIQPVDE